MTLKRSNGQGFEDHALANPLQTLQATMIQEERLILGRQYERRFGIHANAVAGRIGPWDAGLGTWERYRCRAVAASVSRCRRRQTVNIGQSLAIASATVPGQITRTNADGTTGHIWRWLGAEVAAATVVTTGSTSSIAATVANPAMERSVTHGSGGAAGSEALAITSINSVSITAAATGTQLAPRDSNGLEHFRARLDGLLTQASKSGSRCVIAVQATGNRGHRADPADFGRRGRDPESDVAFVNFYNKYRLSPSTIHVSSAGVGQHHEEGHRQRRRPCRSRSTPTSTRRRTVRCWRRRHRKLPEQGCRPRDSALLCIRTCRPHDLLLHQQNCRSTANVTACGAHADAAGVLLARMAAEDAKYEYGVCADGVLQNFAPFSMGTITNIGNG